MKRILLLVGVALGTNCTGSRVLAAPAKYRERRKVAPRQKFFQPWEMRQISKELAVLSAERNQLLWRFKPGSPEVRILDQRIAMLVVMSRQNMKGAEPHLIPPLTEKAPPPRWAPPGTKPRFQLLNHGNKSQSRSLEEIANCPEETGLI